MELDVSNLNRCDPEESIIADKGYKQQVDEFVQSCPYTKSWREAIDIDQEVVFIELQIPDPLQNKPHVKSTIATTLFESSFSGTIVAELHLATFVQPSFSDQILDS